MHPNSNRKMNTGLYFLWVPRVNKEKNYSFPCSAPLLPTRPAAASRPTDQRAQAAAPKAGELAPHESHTLLQRLTCVGDDHQCFLSKFMDRVDR
jgi:hypothetical protein